MVISSGLDPERPSAKPEARYIEFSARPARRSSPYSSPKTAHSTSVEREVVHRADDPQRGCPAADGPQDPRGLHRVGAQAAVFLRDQEARPPGLLVHPD